MRVNLPNFALLLEYDGSYFSGFQRQRDKHTVQEALENAFLQAYKEKINISAAGRTDAGVHALGMIASFVTQRPISDFHRMISALNALTKQGVSVLGVKEMPESFHARFSCTEREYVYLILNSKYKHPLWEGRAFRIHEKINFKKIQEELPSFLGKHDFRSFAKTISVKNKITERQVLDIQLKESCEFSGLYAIHIRGTGFLHNMVRIIAGTLLDIGRGKITQSIQEILESEDRKLAGTTLPPFALYFKKAYYKDYPEIEELYSNTVIHA